MSDEDKAPEVQDTTAEVVEESTETTETSDATTASDSSNDWDGDFDKERAKSLIAKLRDQEKAQRSESKKAKAAAKEAEQRVEQMLESIAKVVGLTEGETPDPNKLLSELQAANSKTRDAHLELSLLKAANKLGVDADRLLDSRSFMRELGELDEDDKSFSNDLKELVEQAIDRDPTIRLKTKDEPKSPAEDKPKKTKPVVKQSSADVSGTNEDGAITEQQLNALFAQNKVDEIERLRKAGKLDHLL